MVLRPALATDPDQPEKAPNPAIRRQVVTVVAIYTLAQTSALAGAVRAADS